MKYFLILFFVFPVSLYCQNNNYITNKEYNAFVTYVRDSSFRYTMGNEVDEEAFHTSTWDNENYNSKDTFASVNWKTKLDVNSSGAREALEPWYYSPNERLNRKRAFDTRKFIHNGIKVYPDVMVWCRDSNINKSWAIFLSKYYNTHPFFQDYPVYGLSEDQVNEYLKWKYPNKKKKYALQNLKEINLTLPKEKLHLTTTDYYKFYIYARDSTIRMVLCQEVDEERYCLSANKYWEEINPPIVKWKRKIRWNDPAEVKSLSFNKILTKENEVDNRLINYSYSTLDYYKSIEFPDSIKRWKYFKIDTINIRCNNYLDEISPINLKKPRENNITYNSFSTEQLKAFYHWKNSNYPTKNVFDGFIPHDSNIELLRNGKLTNEFYSFAISIPTITIE